MKDFIFDIIDSTIHICPIYKINFAFYERHGSKGYTILESIKEKFDDTVITIADAKRGDIGNSSKYYADSIFKHFKFDSITVSPYMGYDSIFPFTEYNDKGVFVLCLTSNPGSKDIQNLKVNNLHIYENVIKMCLNLNDNKNIGIVVGATKTSDLKLVKQKSSDLPWLMPGVGFQGGNLKESLSVGENNNKGLAIINISRGILNAGTDGSQYGSIKDMSIATENYTRKIRSLL
tara:strand:- start:114 stop:812 length:699 start_codon:yes stop_codon:yes gene_type:complete